MKKVNLFLLCSWLTISSCISDVTEQNISETLDVNSQTEEILAPDTVNSNDSSAAISDDCLLLKTYISYIKEDEKLDSIIVVDEYISWDIDWHLDFDAEGQSLPKSKKERMERLKSETTFDPYPFMYIYAYLEADSIFNKQDRIEIRKQAQVKKSRIDCNIKNVQFVKKESKKRNKLGFHPPLYSKDHNYAILRAFIDYQFVGGTYTGIVQTIYYKRGVRGWEKVFSSPKWILG